MKDNKEVEKVQELSDNMSEMSIEPEDIILDDDTDMPEPETKDYTQSIRCTPLFLELFYEAINHMPYASILKNANNEQIKLIDLVKYVEAKKNNIDIKEMDKIISFIANIEFKYSRKLMEKIENQSQQKELFEIISQ